MFPFFFLSCVLSGRELAESELLSECQEEAQQLYFHKWRITANALMFCLIFMKEKKLYSKQLWDYINCYGHGDRNKKQQRERGGAKMKKGEKDERMERKKDEITR
ncbi:hypothetical protein CHARACLAT_012554 [Characodon lateralis]|uniref:Secreted protein n=1 Tax=Characodon lateralis TaxID=208331 RepID=A0ABU7E9J4_9TELE|nr:hypothetical protein [Characodon lateralis]